MKGFIIGLLIVIIIVGTAFGVKWEIETFNAKYNPSIEDQLKDIDDNNIEDTNINLDY